MVFLKNRNKKIQYQYAIRSLKKASAADLLRHSEERALKAWQGSTRRFPFYKGLLTTVSQQRQKITDIDSFKKYVPIIDKNFLYHSNRIEELLFKKGKYSQIRSLLLSSGSSGVFSYGLSTQKEIKQNARFLEMLLEYFFHILEERTLIINSLANGVKLPVVEAVTAEIGPRTDSLLFLLKNVSPHFDQTILIGDHIFIKNSLEEGCKERIAYENLKIHLILGGSFFVENLRDYLAYLLKSDLKDPNRGRIFSSMGISEFGLNLFFESPETIHLRRLTQTDPILQDKLLGPHYPSYLPMFFNYFPQLFFLEEVQQKILITGLNPNSPLPLIRYDTQDIGKILQFDELEVLLKGKEDKANLLPPFKSPLVLMYSKLEPTEYQNIKIYPQQILQGIFSDFEAASLITGYIKFINQDHQTKLCIQLKDGIANNEGTLKQIRKSALQYVNQDLPLILYSYKDFPFGLTLDYEHKFKFV